MKKERERARPRATKKKAVRSRAEIAWAAVCKTRGMVAQIAIELAVNKQAVHQWKIVPLDRVVEVERITGVPRERLRPDYHLPRARNGHAGPV
jgi:DNA-binding transcriptional regulator YdaS (Cro superfamily)